MLMPSDSYSAHAIVHSLHQNYSEQFQAAGPTAISNTTVVALQEKVSAPSHVPSCVSVLYFLYQIIACMFHAVDSIVSFPWTFIQYLTTLERSTSPLADEVSY
ncbi:hypothetical protein PsorP6_010954 [Peronosclerospora sorghi]|uniref:Uncharacterized protein n=1 Tax=Peronosclerospora sorghi TaxID=230839 RepID=A0ACC0VXI9_9STRA|nr:hypothetical protein PsorP6_010954 [Peronosclerospora sorghi]